MKGQHAKMMTNVKHVCIYHRDGTFSLKLTLVLNRS